MEQKKTTQEEGFRQVLEDVLPLVERLAGYCNSLEELSAMCRHALDNEAQLRLLMSVVLGKR